MTDAENQNEVKKFGATSLGGNKHHHVPQFRSVS